MTDRPIRVQLRRVKGWRMPENTVAVSRSKNDKWGNPFHLDSYETREQCVTFFRLWLAGEFPNYSLYMVVLRARRDCHSLLFRSDGQLVSPKLCVRRCCFHRNARRSVPHRTGLGWCSAHLGRSISAVWGWPRPAMTSACEAPRWSS